MKQEVSIIELILRNQRDHLKDDVSINKLIITPEVFFADHCSEEQFKTLLNSLNERELQGLEFLLNLMNDNKKFKVSPFEAYDKNKNGYVWVEIVNKLTNSGFKVRTAGKMWHLIGLYGMGFVTFKCRLEDLYNYIYKD